MKNKISYIAFCWLLVLVIFTVPLLLSYLGAFHPAFDSFAHLRRHMAFLLLIAALPLLFSQLRHGALGLMVFALFCLFSTYETQGIKPTVSTATRHFKLVQANLRYDNPSVDRLIDLLKKQQPDFFTYQEATTHWQARLQDFADNHHYFIYNCQRTALSAIGATGFLSRYPIINPAVETACPPLGALASAKVDIGENKSLTLSSVHLFWPWPYQQKAQLDSLDFESAPYQLLGGDFNAVSWSHAVSYVERKTATRHVEGIAASWLSYRLPDYWRPIAGLPIDQVLMSKEFKLNKVEQLPSIGSDHLPMMIEFSLDQ